MLNRPFFKILICCSVQTKTTTTTTTTTTVTTTTTTTATVKDCCVCFQNCGMINVKNVNQELINVLVVVAKKYFVLQQQSKDNRSK
jgi:hypothetical protein